MIDTVAWSNFASDIAIYDTFDLRRDDVQLYEVEVAAAKWLHYETRPNSMSGERYVASLTFNEPWISVRIDDTTPFAVGEPPEAVEVTWVQYGLTSASAVPAWRQSLWGSATLLSSNPAASVVLAAAGFEAFFLETMRLWWREAGLAEGAFKRLADSNPSIARLVEWLPAAVNRRPLPDTPEVHERWQRLVNKRRNDVMHRAQVHATSDEARESLAAAIEAVTCVDELALVRPHAYYAGATA